MKLLSIFTTEELLPTIQQYIASEARLDELVEVCDLLTTKPSSNASHIIVRAQKGIMHPLDWENTLPPYLLPEETAFTREHLLGLIFARLGNEEKARFWLSNHQTYFQELHILSRLQQGIPISPDELHSDFHPFEEYRFCHNSAVLHHYAATEDTFDPGKTDYFYREAIQCAPDGEYAAFTTKQYALFLSDVGDLKQAESVLQQAIPFVISEEAGVELRFSLCQVWIKKLSVPYDSTLLEQLKNTLWDTIQYYKKEGRETEEALALMDAAQIAHYSESFTEALGYINRAIDIFRKEEIEELLAQAHHRRAMLLYTWAKTGNPQFLKGALDNFREALKVFNRENAPEVFAEIHQYLGIIYAEIPDETLKRGVWAAVSSSAFQEALAFYKKDKYPYEYAMICNHFGNALTKYPAATHSDNMEKALFYYNEALNIRNADSLPFERATTLLNYVEACWHLGIEENSSNRELFQEMVQKSTEALHLTNDPNIREEATQQLSKLESLRLTLEKEEQTL